MKTKLTPMQTMGINNSCKDVGSDLSAGHYGFEIVDKPKELVDSLSYPSYRLHYVIQGSVSLYYAGKKVVLKKNSVFVLMPNTSVSYQVENKKSPTLLYWVTFNGYRAKHYCQKTGLTEEHPFAILSDSKMLAFFYEPFMKASYPPSMLNAVMQKNLLNIIEYLYASRVSNTDNESWQLEQKHTQTYMQKILYYINKHIADPNLSIKMFAEKLTVPPSTLSRLFKQEMSVCFTEYVTLKRCELAVSYLEKGTYKVNEVARMVGFEDPLYFSRVYKKVFKCSPMKTVRRVKENERKKHQQKPTT
jgi:AraC-like DNA-binding protein